MHAGPAGRQALADFIAGLQQLLDESNIQVCAADYSWYTL